MNATEIAVILAAVLAGSLVKSVTGMGLPLVAIPVMTLFVPTETAVAVMAIPNAAQNFVLAVRHRDALPDTSRLALFCTAGVGGAVVGALSLGVVPDAVTRLVLVAAVAGYLVTSLASPDLRIGPAVARRATGPVGFVAGMFQGAVGISGPIVGTWHHGLRLSREAFVLSIATAFFLTGTTQAVVLGARGTLDGRIGVSLLLMVVVLATVPVGAHLRDRLSVAAFERLVLALLAASCLSIVIDLVIEAL